MNTKRRSWGLGRGSAAREGRTAQRWARGLRQAAQRLVRIGCLLLLALPAAAQDRGIDLHPSPVAQAPAIAGDYWALIIGINHYTKLSPDNQLEAARNDATAIAGVLREHYGFEPKRMTELYDEQASRSAILRNLRALARTLTLKDNLFIYYAGHGLLDKETGLGGWVPSDAEIDDPSNQISNAEIREYLKTIKAKHIYTVVDSCFSEALMGKRSRSLVDTGALNAEAARELYADKSRWVLTSGGLFPVPDRGKGDHSVFAHYLLAILEHNKSPYLTPQQIIASLQPLVANESSQTPKSSPIDAAGDEGGQFLLQLASAQTLPPPPAEQVHPDPQVEAANAAIAKRLEQEKQQLEADLRKFRQEQLQAEREARDREQAAETRRREAAARLRADEQRLDREKEALDKKKKAKPAFMPPPM